MSLVSLGCSYVQYIVPMPLNVPAAGLTKVTVCTAFYLSLQSAITTVRSWESGT
jgi:hypothetical protein